MKQIPTILLAVTLWSTLSVAFSSASDRPNILLVFTDDHAYQAISAYGSRINQTPNIDRLAIEGMRFDNCYVTNSICGPCRATVLTGKYSHLNGFIAKLAKFIRQHIHYSLRGVHSPSVLNIFFKLRSHD